MMGETLLGMMRSGVRGGCEDWEKTANMQTAIKSDKNYSTIYNNNNGNGN